MTALADVALEDRYAAPSGAALLTGTQAIVRLLLEQRRLDVARGLRTAAFVTGYPGSPLGGLDREVVKARRHLEPAGVVFEAGLNEELAATAVSGTQLVPELPGREVDGVTGFWFGKAPGLDRAADAIRHATTSGTSHLGGAVALVGDDPTCKSSTLPSSCELMAESLALPLFSPGSVAEIVGLGLHAVALSRHAGLWTAMKIVSDVADASAVVELGVDPGVPPVPEHGRGGPPTLLGASAVAAEHDLLGARTELARAYGRAQGLNPVVLEPAVPRLAIVAPGVAFASVVRALEQLGLDEAACDVLGLRLVRLGLVWPLHPDDIAAFAEGVDEVLVVEDKRPFVERQIRDALYGRPSAPAVLGKRDAAGGMLVPLEGAVDADVVARLLRRALGDRLPATAAARLDVMAARTRGSAVALPAARTPFFCSGCPHNLSTRTPEDQLVGAGIGCHALVAVDPAGMRGRLLGAPQMGGEGAQWIGMAPFTTDAGYVQNIGDGTFHHSGSLAIRAAAAAGVQITFRLLYNDAIAMTGGQAAPGRIGVVDLTHWLVLEGVRRIIVTTEDPESFADAALAPQAEVRHRDRLPESLAELQATPGVTVLLHTDRCATEERRLRKRGRLPDVGRRVWINERVCEGCGDCGRASTCLSVVPTETEFGRKTAIHQSSCTQDLSCLDGDCPSFVVVRATGDAPRPAVEDPPVELVAPLLRAAPAEGTLIRMPGVGGTGVVTVSQILQMAALVEGRWASGLDQTGLAQKGGAVISDVRIADGPVAGSLRAGRGEVDLLLGLDPLGALSPETLRTLDPERTVAVMNRQAPATAAMVTDPGTAPVPNATLVAALDGHTRARDAVWLDAGAMAEQLFADHMPTNVIMLGAAYQTGCLPLSADAIERAIAINGAAVEVNLAAFRWGRAAVVDRDAVIAALVARAPTLPPVAQEPPEPVRATLATARLDDALHDLVAMRAADLAGYQDARYAMRYVTTVLEAHARVRASAPDAVARIVPGYARGLHKLMAYKDEYEVARLHLDPHEQARLRQAFGPGVRPEVLLHPPVLRALGLRRKIALRRSAAPLFGALRAARRLRGTPLDPFGRGEVRQTERALIGEYTGLVERALDALPAADPERIAELAALPNVIRGYEDIKLDSIARFRAAAAELAAQIVPPGDQRDEATPS